MRYFCSFPPKVTFPGCSEEFLFPLTKIQNIYHIDNQFVIFLSQFHDYHYFNVMADLIGHLSCPAPTEHLPHSLKNLGSLSGAK